MAGSQSYNVMGIGEIWWEESHDWCVTLQGSGPGTGRAGEVRGDCVREDSAAQSLQLPMTWLRAYG